MQSHEASQADMPSRLVEFSVGKAVLHGDLTMSRDSDRIVIFAHGSGSSRHSPRNRHVAAYFNSRGLATLLFDLLTESEERIDMETGHLRFDIGLLAERLRGAVEWIVSEPRDRPLSVGLFGASTGAAAALVAAARLPWIAKVVVSRGGRPDLAGDALPLVKAPVLLIVGGEDTVVIGMNRAARERLRVQNQVAIVAGATHLFEEPGALDEVARLAADWFLKYL
jgi:putative phosphoribosyl transferase